MLLRVYAKMDSSNKIAFPRGICKALEIKAGEKLELTIVGMNPAPSKNSEILRMKLIGVG